MSYAQAMGNVARSVWNFVDGATQLAVNGTITGMVVRPASSLMALPAAVFMGPEAYTAIQADLQERWSPESNNPGAIAIQQSLGQMLQPVGQALGELRTASENRFGDGPTTAGFAIAQGALEVGGFLGGVAAIPGGRAALGSLGGSIQGGFNTLADAMPVGSGAGGLRGPALQWGAVGDLEGLGVGGVPNGAATPGVGGPIFNPAGKVRAEKFADFQQGVSLRGTVDLIAGDNPVVTYTTSGKTLYTNPTTGKQVVYDNAGNYFRVEDTTVAGPLRYTDQFGQPIPNNVPLIKPNGVSQTGVPSDVRKALTHFTNTD